MEDGISVGNSELAASLLAVGDGDVSIVEVSVLGEGAGSTLEEEILVSGLLVPSAHVGIDIEVLDDGWLLASSEDLSCLSGGGDEGECERL